MSTHREDGDVSVSEFDPPTGEFENVDSDEPGELNDDVIFGLLKNQRRRDTLRFLRDHGESSTLSELAEHIAAKENDIEVRQLSSDQRKRVYIGLYQCHLPKMDSAGVIDFDKNRGDVEMREPAEQLLPYLQDDATDESSADTAAAADDPATYDAPRRDRGVVDLVCGAVGLVVAGALAGVPGLRRLPSSWLAGVAAGGWLASRLRSSESRRERGE